MSDLTIVTAKIDVAVRPRVERARHASNRPAKGAAIAVAAPSSPAPAPVMRPDRSVVLKVENKGDHVRVVLVPNAAALTQAASVLAAAQAQADGATVDVSHGRSVVASTDPSRIRALPRPGGKTHVQITPHGSRPIAGPSAPGTPVVAAPPAPDAPGKPAGLPGKPGGG